MSALAAVLSTPGAALLRVRQGVRFDRNELSGAFGDMGTDFPLIAGMILTASLDPASVLVMFGAMHIVTALTYGMPLPVQPLKAMSTIVITQKVSGEVLYGGGFAIGVLMFVLSVTGLIGWLARVVPKSVVRGIQLGLGIQLALLALKGYVPSEGAVGFGLAGASFLITLLLIGNRRIPPAPLVILLGVVFALVVNVDLGGLGHSVGFALPGVRTPSPPDILTGLVVLALPQLPLSLGNSVLATRQVAADLFPERPLSVRKISLTYSLMNLVNPFFGGVPTCHGSGGMAGHYAFGARTGGSVVIYGSFYLVLGLFFSGGFGEVVRLFPKPVLGIILAFEALALMRLVRDTATSATDFSVVLLVGLIAAGLPYGYIIGLVLGTALAYGMKRRFLGLAGG